MFSKLSLVAAIAGASLLHHGAEAKAVTPSLITSAKTLIASNMTDPASLQYRNLRVVNATVSGTSFSVACGEYNSKNRLGGYTGFRTFAFEPTTLKGVLTYNGEDFDYFTADGRDLGSLSDGSEVKARILAVCLGMKQ